MKVASKVWPAQQLFLYSAALMMVIATLFFAITPKAQAASLTASQVQAVVELLSQFGSDKATIENVQLALSGASRSDVLKAVTSTAATSSMPKIRDGMLANAGACGVFARPLSRGASGDDVARLQKFLKEAGAFREASTTGYFGSVTEAALREWQAKEGIVISGDASTTGFGAVGPKTRQLLMASCNDRPYPGDANASSTRLMYPNATSTPVCILTPSKQRITQGESVVLTWESRNATWASSVSGDKAEPNGSVTMTPSETMTYVKRVYSATGEGRCAATVFVGDDAIPALDAKVVNAPGLFSRTFSTMTSGMAAVLEGYVSIFE